MRSKVITKFAIGAAATAMFAGPALADGARDLRDLVGARGSSGESQLRARGYEHVETHRAGDVLAAYWWNEEEDDCVLVRTSDGRYQAITDASDQDCGHHEGSGTAVGAAVAVGLGAALVAALASNHDDDDERDHDSREQYDRGFSDGLHNSAYHNYDRSDAYSDGYEAGVEQREHNLSHRRSHRGAGGYQQSFNATSLNGAQASSADGSLRSNGFNDVDSFRSGNTLYTIWWNGQTRQCLQMTVADGRVYDIRDIRTHPRCGSQSSSSGSASSGNSARIDWYPRLVGAAGDGARTQIRQNGFSRVTRQGGGEGSIWYNSASRQCLQITVSGGRVTEADDISGDRRCR